MRILMISQFYPPTIGGEERHVQTLSAELAARGHEVAVATLWHEGLAEFEQDGAVRVYRIRGTVQRATWLFSEGGRRHAPPLPDPELSLAMRRIIARERPEIVHAHNWLVHSFVPLKAWSGAKLVLTLHDYSLVCAQKRLMYHDRTLCDGPGFTKCLGCAADHYGPAKGVTTVLANWAMGAAERAAVDMFVPVSQVTAVGNGLVGSGLPYEVIPNLVPDDIGLSGGGYESYTAQLPGEDYLLLVGDLSRDKGVDVLLSAYADLATAPPLVLIGRECADTPKEFPANVVVLKSWPHGAVMEAWRHSIVGLVPSVVPETFGIVALEAMATGRPVIASRIGALIDVIADGETGFLVPPGDPLALRQAIERLLTDEALRHRMGQAAKRRAARFQASTVVPSIEHLYSALLQKRSGARRRQTPVRRDAAYAIPESLAVGEERR